MRSNPFQGKAIIVTGASAGIGRAMARQLASQGARLAIAARRAERLEEVAEECRRMGGEAIAIPTDVADEAQCKSLVERTVAAYGRLDMLVSNAGMATAALFEELPDLRLFKHTMDVNFYGCVHCVRHAIPHLKKTQGRIVAVSSAAGKTAVPYNAPYVASKFAMHGFLDSLRMELSPHGVSVTLVCPWWVVSEFHQSMLDKDGAPAGRRGSAIHTDRMMSAERCAHITLRAASRRRREVWMGFAGVAAWLKLLSPRLLDLLAVEAFMKPAIRRARARTGENK
jgi:short-subunit dehydrogenase